MTATGRTIESACYCGSQGASEYWVVMNGADRQHNLGYLQQACDALLHDKSDDYILAILAFHRMEGIRLRRLISNMETYGVLALSYAECCGWLDGYAQLLNTRLTRLEAIAIEEAEQRRKETHPRCMSTTGRSG